MIVVYGIWWWKGYWRTCFLLLVFVAQNVWLFVSWAVYVIRCSRTGIWGFEWDNCLFKDSRNRWVRENIWLEVRIMKGTKGGLWAGVLRVYKGMEEWGCEGMWNVLCQLNGEQNIERRYGIAWLSSLCDLALFEWNPLFHLCNCVCRKWKKCSIEYCLHMLGHLHIFLVKSETTLLFSHVLRKKSWG